MERPTDDDTTARNVQFHEHHQTQSNTLDQMEYRKHNKTPLDAYMPNGDESELTDTKIEQIFLHSESEADQPLQARDALSLFFQSIESQTRNLPIHLRLQAKRKISDVIFDLEERHLNEMNQDGNE